MILMPLPDSGFEPSEASIPWRVLRDHGFDVAFATPTGRPAEADPRLLTGDGLWIWKGLLMASADAIACHASMIDDDAYRHPMAYDDIDPGSCAAMILPGGHAPGMRAYLESKVLQDAVVELFRRSAPVGAICHGVLVVARSIDGRTGRSVIHRYVTTSLLKWQELLAHRLTSAWLGDYYRTYPRTVEDEVRTHLADPKSFVRGNLGYRRDSMDDLRHGFAVVDRNYVSARWPGDVHRFAFEFLKLVERALLLRRAFAS